MFIHSVSLNDPSPENYGGKPGAMECGVECKLSLLSLGLEFSVDSCDELQALGTLR
jgi:hypothetical protein